MHISKKRWAGVFIGALMSVCMGLPGDALSEAKETGYYAGPLSIVAKTVIEVVVQKDTPTDDNFMRRQGKSQEKDFEKSREFERQTFQGPK